MNKRSFLWALVGLLVVAAMMLSACSTPAAEEAAEPAAEEAGPADAEEPAAEEAEPIKLTYYSTSAEVNAMFEEMFAEYHELNPNVTIELIPTGVGEGQSEKLQSLYASGNAPNFMNIDPSTALEYQDQLLPLTYESAPWMDLLVEGAVEAGKFDDVILGVPFTTQGYGLLYNKRIVDEVYGGTFDPSTIDTQDALKEFFEKIDAEGIPVTMWHGANWSLGAHYLGMTYAVQGPETSDGVAYLEDLKAGTANIADSPIFQGYMDTFDLITQYNYRADDPLVADYAADAQAFANGEVATYFMGDWLWTVIGELERTDSDFGIIPVPWSNDPTDYGNTQVVVSMPKIMTIDASQSTPEEQQASIEALEWMLTTPEGQEYFIVQGFSMPYTNVRPAEYNSMTTAIQEYIAAGKTINIGCFTYMTGDAWTQTGNLMLQYLDGVISRDELAEGIDAYWQSVP